MEYENGILFISEGSMPTIGKNNKEFDDHGGQIWEVLHRKALGTIRMCLVVSVDFNISKEKTTKDLKEALDKLYEKPSASNKVFLMK
jgi:hypothetical protein